MDADPTVMDCSLPDRENGEYEPRQWDYDTGLPMAEATRGKKLYDSKI